MTYPTVSTGYVSIIQVGQPGNIKESMEWMKDNLLDLVNSREIQEGHFQNFIFLDLQPFHIVNSTLIGAIGSAIMDEKVDLIGLCGVQPAVADLLHRFGVATTDNIPPDFSSHEIRNNFDKTIIFDSLREGLASLA